MNTISVVLILTLKSHWFTKKLSLAMTSTSLLSMALTSSMPTMEHIVIGRVDKWSSLIFHLVRVQGHDDGIIDILWKLFIFPCSKSEDFKARHESSDGYASIFLL